MALTPRFAARSSELLLIGLLLLYGLSALAPTPLRGGTVVHHGDSLSADPGLVVSAGPAASFTLSENGIDPSAVGLSWSHTSDLVFDHYEVDLSTGGSSGPWTPVATFSDPNATTYTETGLSPSSTYWFEVTDYAALVGSTVSNVLSATLPSLPSLTASNATSSAVDLGWTNPGSYGGTITFDSYVVNESAGGGNYATIATLSAEATHAYRVTGLAAQTQYSFQVVVVDRCCSGTALRSASNVVSVGTPVPVGASAVATPTTVDAGQFVSFTCSASGGVPPYAYAWAFGDGQNGSGQTTSHAYSSAGVFNATCRVSDASGASAGAPLLIVVDPPPSLLLSAAYPSAAPGSSLDFSAHPSGGSGTFVSIGWTFGDGKTASGSDVSHPFAMAGSYNVSASVRDTNGGFASNSMSIRIEPIVVALVAPPLFGQSGVSLNFSANASGGTGGPFSESWAFGDGASGSGSSVSHSYATPGSYVVTITVTDALGAVGTASSSPILVYNAIHAAIEVSDGNPMPGASVVLTAQISGGSGNYSCVWNFEPGIVRTSCSVAHSWSQAGRYDIVLTVVDPKAGNASSHSTLTVGNPPALGGTPPPSSSHWWILGILALPAIVIVWRLAQHGSSSAPASPPSAPPPPPASPPASRPSAAPTCRRCGASVRSWMTTCPECEAPLEWAPTRPSPFGEPATARGS